MKQPPKLSFLALFLLITGILVGQTTDYFPLTSKGKLPSDFVTRSSKKYEQEKRALKKEKKDKKVKKSFLLSSSFEIDKMLLSGKVLFNDDLSKYVNQVADNVLANDPELRKKLRFYILKSPAVNAFATNQGIICVNIGMLAQLHNEAELAMVLCHEIQHYLLKHSIKIAVESEKIKKGKGIYRKLEDREGKLLVNCLFSKEQEAEADLKGFQLFKKTGYSATGLTSLFDVLKYAELPFDDIAVNKDFFENSSYKIPSFYFLQNTKAIDTTDNLDDSKSTHPSTTIRKKIIENEINNLGSVSGKSVFLVGQNEFEQVQKIARFEQTNLFLMSHDYERCIYNAFLLLHKEPNNIFLRKTVLHALTALGAYSAKNDISKVHINRDSIEGKSQSIYDMMQKMDSVSLYEISCLALAYGAKLMKEYPNDKEIRDDIRASAFALNERDKNLTFFSDTLTTRNFSIVENKSKDSSETNAIASDDESEIKKDEDSYSRYAVVNYKNEPWMLEAFNDSNLVDNWAKDNEYEGRKLANKQTKALGLEKVIVVNPQYIRINDNLEESVRYLKSEAGQVDFSERIKSNAKVAKLNVEVIDNKNLTETEVQKLNDIALLQEYLSDRNFHNHMNVPFPHQYKLEEIIKKYDCKHILWSGVISYDERFKGRTALAIVSSLVPVMLPFTLIPMINKGHWTFYFNLVYDLESNRAVFSNFREINNRTAGYILNSHIYDTFYQIKHK